MVLGASCSMLFRNFWMVGLPASLSREININTAGKSASRP